MRVTNIFTANFIYNAVKDGCDAIYGLYCRTNPKEKWNIIYESGKINHTSTILEPFVKHYCEMDICRLDTCDLRHDINVTFFNFAPGKTKQI